MTNLLLYKIFLRTKIRIIINLSIANCFIEMSEFGNYNEVDFKAYQ